MTHAEIARLCSLIDDPRRSVTVSHSIYETPEVTITGAMDVIADLTKKFEQYEEKNKMREVLFLAPNWQYVNTVINNLSKNLGKKKIPHTASSNEFYTDGVHVTFVCSDPLKWTATMFKGKDAIFGKKELLDIVRNGFFSVMPRHPNMSLEKYIIENTVSDGEPQKNPPTSYLPEIKKVHFNDPVTVVLWADGTKTIVKCQEGDIYSEETGLALCIAKKALGNMPNFNNVFRKWLPEKCDDNGTDNAMDFVSKLFGKTLGFLDF